jgi:hypothetical protein
LGFSHLFRFTVISRHFRAGHLDSHRAHSSVLIHSLPRASRPECRRLSAEYARWDAADLICEFAVLSASGFDSFEQRLKARVISQRGQTRVAPEVRDTFVAAGDGELQSFDRL